MRIALLTQRFPPACCGVGDYTAQLARALNETGAAPIVFTGTSPVVEPPGVRVVSVALGGWRDLRTLLGRLEEEHVDAVQIEYSGYSWGRWGFAFWVNALVVLLRWRGVPVTVALHEFQLRLAQHPLQAPIIALQLVHILLLAATASHVVTNTEPRVRMLQRILFWRRGRIRYRPNSSTIPVVVLKPGHREALREKRGAGAQDVVVASFGMFAAGKDYESLIRAVAKAARRVPLKLWLLGNWQAARPEYIEHLRTLVRELGMEADVFWSGLLSSEEVSGHLHASDIFVLPQPDGHLTRSSAFMAAAAHGLPVIAVRNPSHQSEFVHGKHAWLLPPRDLSALASALQELAQKKDLRERLGRNLLALYQAAFDWKNVVKAGAMPAVDAGRASVPLPRDKQMERTLPNHTP